jgi:hypothetical protein
MTDSDLTPVDDSWENKWIPRIDNDNAAGYHSNGIGVPFPEVYHSIIDALPPEIIPVFNDYIHSLLHREDSGE